MSSAKTSGARSTECRFESPTEFGCTPYALATCPLPCPRPDRISPPGTILPVSAAILRDRHGYDEVLSGFSRPLLDLIRWEWSGRGGATTGPEMVVESDGADLYQYFDPPPFAEYLYDRVADSVRRDLKEELGFVAVFDGALSSPWQKRAAGHGI